MSSTSPSDDDNDENRFDSNDNQLLTAQKSLIYKHPLFPVLVYVLERCEQATLNPLLLLNTDDPCTSSSFEHNLKIFLSKNPDILTTPKHTNDDTSSIIDNFYIDAMQVLRIHLLELDKVNDLCRDFCQRYIACLKVKLNANNIFTDDEDDDDDDDGDDVDDFTSNIDEDSELSEDNDDEEFIMHDKHNLKDQHYGKQSVLNNGFNSICHPYTTEFNGQTPLSQIISSGPSHTVDSSSASSILFDSFCTKKRKQSTVISSSASKRGVLPKSATSIMRSWLFQHIVHPYPTEDEKRAISQKTNLSLLQVNNWFINARRRILQPMLEASNPDLAANKKKKRHDTSTDDHHHNQARQISNINRYWPSNLVQFDTTTTTTKDQRNKCVDTVGWHDKVNKSTCSDYVVHGWCVNNKLTSARNVHSIPALNFPELNCCVCGKKASINLPVTARWNQNATTIARSANDKLGSSPNIPFAPRSITIDDRNTLYIGDNRNSRVVLISLNSVPISIDIEHESQLNMFKVDNPMGIYVSRTSIYITDNLYYRVQKWSKKFSNPITVAGIDGVQGNSTSLITLSSSWNLFIDNYENIFVCDTDNHRVIMFPWNSRSGTSGVIVAGTGFKGLGHNELNTPSNIFVDDNQILYITDLNNHRIQKWILGGSKGISVAGSGVCGKSLSELCYPTSVLVDFNGNMYICDSGNYRIMRWALDAYDGECIAACSGDQGTAADQLRVSFSMALDSDGSLYVSDTVNYRIQKFQILDDPTRTTTQSWTTTSSKVALTKSNIFITSILILFLQIIL